MQSFLNNLRYATRMMGKNPGFSLVALVTLALGIGANTALFSVIDAALLRPLPFHDPSRLVAMRCVDEKDANFGGEISYPAFLDWREQSRSFESMSVWNTSSFTYTGGEQPESVPSAVVSANLFSMLGAAPAAGRTFTPEEDRPGGEQLPVILSYEFWQSHFGGDRTVLGRSLTLDHRAYSVVGIMPPHFQFPVQSARVELWTTMARDLEGKTAIGSQRGVSYLQVIARLKPGISVASAQSDLALVQDRLNHQYPDNRPRGVAIQSQSEAVAAPVRTALLILLGAVGFVLLIACANVAGLLLARAAARQREITIRSALGASRGMIVRQLLIESMLLAMMGGVLGLLVARWSTLALVRMIPEGLARASEIGLDWRVLLFTFSIALVTGLLFGLAPAVQASKFDLNRSLSESRGSTNAAPMGARLRGALVVSQLAISFVLLIGCGLLLRSFVRLTQVDAGFRSDHVLTFLLDVPTQHYPRAQRPVFIRNLLQSTRNLPGVKSASAIFGLPLSDQSVFTRLEIEGRPIAPSQRPRVAFRIIEAGYFKAMGIRLVQGRSFVLRDEEGGPALAIVNQTFVQKMFNGENPIGRRIKPDISFGENRDPAMREIVGVVADVKSFRISGEAVPEVYAPETPADFIGEMTVVVRTANDPNALVPAVRALVSSMDKELPLRDVKTLDDYVSASISEPRFETTLLGIFAGLALTLTAIGLYGLVSYSVARRNREIGIRIALGASRESILGMVVREGSRLVAMGAGVGLVASLLASRLMRGMLYEIGVADPMTFLAVPLLLTAVALLASYVPARRATKVDPVLVLRDE
jgi:putative ABC transport system permease protein